MTAEIIPDGEFIITAKSNILAGPLSSRYDSARNGSSLRSSNND